MGVSINEIIAQVNKHPLSKPTRYEVRVYDNKNISNMQEVFFNCSAIQIPGVNLQFYQEKRYSMGLTYPVLENKSYSEILLTFYETEKQIERKYFMDWVDSMVDKETMRMEFYKNYVRDIEIIQYNAKDEIVYSIKLLECSPTNVSQLSRSYDLLDSIPEFNVNIQCQDIEEFYFSNDTK